MIENISDFLSIFILMSFPAVLIVIFLSRIIHKKTSRRKEKVGKYYPEW